MDFIKVFITGGAICFLGQLLLTKFKLSPPKMLTTIIITGGLLEILDLYKYIAAFGGEGAQVPISGLGSLFANAVKTGMAEQGILGVFMFSNTFYKIAGVVILTAVVVSIITSTLFSTIKEK